MFKNLSIREQEVAVEVTKGKSNKEIASNLFVTEKTIKFHLTNVYKKMNVTSRAQLIVVSLRDGWGWKPEPKIESVPESQCECTECPPPAAIDLPAGQSL